MGAGDGAGEKKNLSHSWSKTEFSLLDPHSKCGSGFRRKNFEKKNRINVRKLV